MRRRGKPDPHPMPRVLAHPDLAGRGIDQLVAGAPISAPRIFHIEAESTAISHSPSYGAGRRQECGIYRARLPNRHYVTTVISCFSASPIRVCSSSSESWALRGNGGGHAESDQNHNRHCDDELACSGILAGERNGRSAKTGVRNHVQLISADPGPATGLLTSPDPRHIYGKIRNVRSPRRPLVGARSSRVG